MPIVNEPRAISKSGSESIQGPPPPSWWPVHLKIIVLGDEKRRSRIKPWDRSGLGPHKTALQIATRW